MLGLRSPVTGWQVFEGHELMEVTSVSQLVGWWRKVTRVSTRSSSSSFPECVISDFFVIYLVR